MVLQELLFPNYDTCADYEMYFRFKWMNFVNVLDDMLRFLLDYVMEFPENNRPELLLSLARDSEEN